MQKDFFEIDRLIEDLAKIYATACATSWYKIILDKKPIRKPSKEEYRIKVSEFMKHFEYTLSTFPNTNEGIRFKNYSLGLLKNAIGEVLSGNNKEVEKRFKYFSDYL